jgi:lipoprotein-releasing system ATP-binding protein
LKTLVHTESLEKTFTTAAGELRVLKGITLSIGEGEMVGIVGASGAGKSTLLHIIGALDRPTSGKVRYQGTDIFALDRNALASFRNKRIGFVFQFHHLLPEFTALENVIFPGLIGLKSSGLTNEALNRRGADLLARMGLSERGTHRPGELSGGEQQRVAVARALILEPDVILADEPTGNLDTSTGEDLFRIFQGLNSEKGITFVIVTHNEALSSRCHRTLKMVDGKVIGET